MRMLRSLVLGGAIVLVLNLLSATPAWSVEQYTIGTEDTLQIVVWGHREFSTSVAVRPDGKITLPLVGEVQAAGLTTAALQDVLAKRLSEYVKNPNVTVIVTGVGGFKFEKRINVIGQVAKPRMIQYRDGLTVLDVILMAGGLTPYASANKTKIIRKEGGETREIQVRLKDLMKKGDLSQNIPVKPGDLVIVPESWF